MNGVTESMAGRASIIRMSPLSSSEIYDKDELKFEINPIKNNKRIEELVKLNKESGLIALFYTSKDKGIGSLDDKQVTAVTNFYNCIRELLDLHEENNIDLLIQIMIKY